MNIRKAVQKDCEQIYKLMCILEETDFDYARFNNIYFNQLENSMYEFLVYEENEKILGFISLRFEQQLHHLAYISEIMEFIVAPDCRGKGIGKALFEKACEESKEKSCIQIEGACNRKRVNSHEFYEKQGMKGTHYKFTKEL